MVIHGPWFVMSGSLLPSNRASLARSLCSSGFGRCNSPKVCMSKRSAATSCTNPKARQLVSGEIGKGHPLNKIPPETVQSSHTKPPNHLTKVTTPYQHLPALACVRLPGAFRLAKESTSLTCARFEVLGMRHGSLSLDGRYTVCGYRMLLNVIDFYGLGV